MLRSTRSCLPSARAPSRSLRAAETLARFKRSSRSRRRDIRGACRRTRVLGRARGLVPHPYRRPRPIRSGTAQVQGRGAAPRRLRALRGRRRGRGRGRPTDRPRGGARPRPAAAGGRSGEGRLRPASLLLGPGVASVSNSTFSGSWAPFSATPQRRSGSTPRPFPTSRRVEGIQNPSERNQNQSEQNQSPAERNPNPAERNPNLTSFHESSLFNGLSPTLTGRPGKAGATPIRRIKNKQ